MCVNRFPTHLTIKFGDNLFRKDMGTKLSLLLRPTIPFCPIVIPHVNTRHKSVNLKCSTEPALKFVPQAFAASCSNKSFNFIMLKNGPSIGPRSDPCPTALRGPHARRLMHATICIYKMRLARVRIQQSTWNHGSSHLTAQFSTV